MMEATAAEVMELGTLVCRVDEYIGVEYEHSPALHPVELLAVGAGVQHLV